MIPNQDSGKATTPEAPENAQNNPLAPTSPIPSEKTEPLLDQQQLQQLQAQVSELQGKLQQQQQDLQLRYLAEQQNSHRRFQQDIEKAHKFSIEKFVKGLLPAMDSFEHAIILGRQLKTLPSGEKWELLDKLIEGMELTYQSLQNTLHNHKVIAIGEPGQPFNPKEHEAMAVVDAANILENHVVTVMQKGYQLEDRLLRPAMVTVSRSANN